MNAVFIINARYQADPTLGLVKDLAQGKESRLEPRLMQVLCLLAQQAGQLVSREVLVREVWNDYGGADEGLTQSVSALRKVLHDVTKETIETIPKKGYILHAEITYPRQGNPILAAKKKMGRKALLLVSGIGLIVLAGYALLAVLFGQILPAGSGSGQSKVADLPSTRVPFEEVNKKEEESYWNTVTTRAPDSTEYKLIASGDRRPAFYINNRLVPPDEMVNHAALIKQMKRQLWERRERARVSEKGLEAD